MSTNLLLPLYGPLYGSVYFGTILTTAFYGVTCMQVFYYYTHYEKDTLWTKAFVALIWILNTIQHALAVIAAYKYFMAGLINPTTVLDGTTELVVVPANLVAILTQAYLVRRIYIFSGKRIIVPIIWFILALIEFVSAMIYVAQSLYIDHGLHVVSLVALAKNPFVILATLSLSTAAGVDVLISLCMIFLLVRERIASSVEKTTHILQRLTVFAVNTGTWTATFALLSVLLMQILSFPLNFIYAAFFIPLCPIYCNTLLGNLNARAYIRGPPTESFSNMNELVIDPARQDERHTRGDSFFAKEIIWKTTEVVTFEC